jgi:uncharacterized protein with ParB-like and HNH nuclease domain
MQFSQKTILGLFDSSQKYFVIPVYQRAYSWGKEEWETFINDIREQIKGNNNYFYGNLLLETIRRDVQYEIIDGQQRLTTLTIFMRAIINVLNEKQKTGDKIEINLNDKEKIYLKNGGTIKLRPVEYDQACYDALIIDNKSSFSTQSRSQERIKEAKLFFIKELQKESTKEILKILEKIETTELTCIEQIGKKDSALMFELQNNRGKDLTNMEKLKSYLMYQMYVYSETDEIETNIENISNIFKSIYLIINDLRKLNEDSILIYHCNAYINGYNYRTVEDIKNVFKKSNDKVKWIKHFASELHTSFSNMKQLELSSDHHLNDLNNLGIPAFAYPFFIKGYKYFSNNTKKLSNLFHILEIVAFRYNLINSRADIISRLNEILTSFNGDLNQLKDHFKDKFNESYYWGDARFKEYLHGDMYNNVINYLLWKYEDSIQGTGYSVGAGSIENEQIEHISPQTPTDGNPLEIGYEVNNIGEYDEEFKNDYLNCVGNLMLISGSHNASIGNRPFVEKLASYNSNPLLKQQAEIKTFCDNRNPKWDKHAIDARQVKIINYCITKWNFDSVTTLTE